MKDLSPRQTDILNYIRAFTRDSGFPPSTREIAKHFGLMSLNGIHQHILALTKKGCFENRLKGKSRSLVLTEKAITLLDCPATTHELKLCSTVFPYVENNSKRCEVRANDRKFQVGDFLRLREWKTDGGKYTGREVKRVVTHIIEGGKWGFPASLCVLSIAPIGGRR